MKIKLLFICFALLALLAVTDLAARTYYPLKSPRYKERIQNLYAIDYHRFSFGYSIGMASLKYRIDQNINTKQIYTKSNIGYYVCIRANYKWTQYLDIWTGLGFTQITRNIVFPELSGSDAQREKNSNLIELPVYFKLHTKRDLNIRPYLLIGGALIYDLNSNENKNTDNFDGIFRSKTTFYQFRMGIGIDLYLQNFKLSPSIVSIFSVSNELVPDTTSPSQWTDNIDKLYTQGFLFSLTFQ